jgi:hypothetical protein
MVSPRRSTRIKEIAVKPAIIQAQGELSSKAHRRRKQQKNAASTKTSRLNENCPGSTEAQENAVFLHDDPHTFNEMPVDVLYEAWNA